MKLPNQEAFFRDASRHSDALTASNNLTENGRKGLHELRREVRAKLLEFFWLQSADKRLAARCTLLVYGPICAYEQSLRRLKIHCKGSDFVYERVPAGKSAVAGLRRLQRHAKSDGYLWRKAWIEAAPIVHELLFAAAMKPIEMPISGAPDPETVAPFIPAALEDASAPLVRTSERDQAVIAILRAYRKLYNRKPTNPGPKRTRKGSNATGDLDVGAQHFRRRRRPSTIEFIRRIEIAFEKLLPEGFGIIRSKATLHRLIKQASQYEAP